MHGGVGCRKVSGRARPLIPWLDAEDLNFPPVETALSDPNGLLCAGGDLSVERLVAAYRRGIFPWFSEGEPILWWSPDPRLVLVPDKFKYRRSLRQAIRSQGFEVRINTAFSEVLSLCATHRAEGTWITEAMQAAYRALYARGYGFSAETWQADRLVGGLYGVKIGSMLFGESMVSLTPNASKAALAEICQRSDLYQIELIDCQVPTSHLQSLGASLISRSEFLQQVHQYTT